MQLSCLGSAGADSGREVISRKFGLQLSCWWSPSSWGASGEVLGSSGAVLLRGSGAVLGERLAGLARFGFLELRYVPCIGDECRVEISENCALGAMLWPAGRTTKEHCCSIPQRHRELIVINQATHELRAVKGGELEEGVAGHDLIV